MTHPRRSLVLSVIAVACVVTPPRSAHAQSSQRGQPTTAFAAADLAKLRWLEGTWRGTAPAEPTIYERYHFANDSTIEITYYNDSTLARPAGTGRVYLTVGRIFHTSGAGRWGASHVDDRGAYFIPQVNAHNTFAWKMVSPDQWTSTLRGGLTGHERVTAFDMRKFAAP